MHEMGFLDDVNTIASIIIFNIFPVWPHVREVREVGEMSGKRMNQESQGNGIKIIHLK